MDTKEFSSKKSNLKDVWVFFTLALLISWAIWIFMILFIPSESQLPVMLIGGFGPFFSAIITLWIFEGKMSVTQWLKRTFTIRINPIWYVVGGLLLPIFIGLTHHSVYLLAGGKSGFSFNQPWGIYIASLISTTLLGGGNEEPGWRGFATPRLMKKFHPIIANIIVSIFWVIWHLPLYLGNWSGNDQPLLWFFIYAIGLSIILTWLYYRSNQSIIPVMLLHAATNIIFDYFPMTNTIFSSQNIDFNVFKSIAYWVVAILIILTTKGQLGYKSKN